MNIKEKLLVIKSDCVLDERYIGRLEIRRKDADALDENRMITLK